MKKWPFPDTLDSQTVYTYKRRYKYFQLRKHAVSVAQFNSIIIRFSANCLPLLFNKRNGDATNIQTIFSYVSFNAVSH